jgi:hypothetical protein
VNVRRPLALLLALPVYAFAESIEVAWASVADWHAIAKYEVHWGRAPGVYTERKGVVRWYRATVIDALDVGATYYFAVRWCAPDLKSCGAFAPEFAVTVPPSIGVVPMVPMAQSAVVATAEARLE